jgi:iron complex transport system substrate-binding protein
MGLIWMTGLSYSEQWQGNLPEETREFYRQYYHVDLTDDQVGRLLQWTEGRPQP